MCLSNIVGGFLIGLSALTGSSRSKSRSRGSWFKRMGSSMDPKPIRGHEGPWNKGRRHSHIFSESNKAFPPKSGGNFPKSPLDRNTGGAGSRRSSSPESQYVDALFGIGKGMAKAMKSTSTGTSTRGYRTYHDPSDSLTDTYYGHRGEYDTNDTILSRMEDMEQFYANDPDFDATEQGYDWDEIIDAVNDGFLPEDYLEEKEDEDDDY